MTLNVLDGETLLIMQIFPVINKNNCKAAIYKTRNTGTGNGMRGMFTRIPPISYRIPGNVIILKFRGMFQRIPGNVEEDSGECSREFREIFKKIPGECSGRFRGI